MKRNGGISYKNHPRIKGAQAAALAVFLARTTGDKKLIKKEIAGRFGYDLNRKVDSIRPSYSFDVSCQGTVPEAIIAFLDSNDYEDAIRNAISLGGDSDTLACITGAIAEAYYGPVGREVFEKVMGFGGGAVGDHERFWEYGPCMGGETEDRGREAGVLKRREQPLKRLLRYILLSYAGHDRCGEDEKEACLKKVVYFPVTPVFSPGGVSSENDENA